MFLKSLKTATVVNKEFRQRRVVRDAERKTVADRSQSITSSVLSKVCVLFDLSFDFSCSDFLMYHLFLSLSYLYLCLYLSDSRISHKIT